jgi:imidazolonepropionase
MLIVNIGQLVTPRGDGPVGGAAMENLLIRKDAYLQIVHGKIVSMGSMRQLVRSRERTLDARRGVAIPALVDPHTHAVFAGSREEEYLRRCRGEPYGKGILTTVRAVRAASEEELQANGRRFLLEMLRSGTTTVEIKSGYGLDTSSELKMLRVMRRLAQELPMEIVPTFLGAHAFPEGCGRSEYIAELIGVMIPQVKRGKLAEFCDVFCEDGFFSVSESRGILRAAQGAGLRIKLHADELKASGGSELAAELHATSADHLLKTTPRGMQKMKQAGVIPVLLPGTAFSLRADYAPARAMIELGLPVALGSDFNPGTCLLHSMLFIIGLAVLQMRMSAAEALTAATLNAAAALGQADRLGSLEPGKQADLVILDLENYQQIPYFMGHDFVRTVVQAGRLVYERPSDCPSSSDVSDRRLRQD